jgi:hypothetical protein
MNILMEENSEDCQLQNTDAKSRSWSYSASTLHRPGKRAPTRHQSMSDLSSVISHSFEGQTKDEVSIEYQSKKLPFGKTGKDMRTERFAKFAEHKYFLICISCFWCASYLKSDIMFLKCPICNEGKIDSMPLGEDEIYRFNHSLDKGIELEFSRY